MRSTNSAVVSSGFSFFDFDLAIVGPPFFGSINDIAASYDSVFVANLYYFKIFIQHYKAQIKFLSD
jgi:hypothetical protein